MKTIQQQWEGFAAMVFREPVGKVQQDEMRKAFYAGAWSLFCALEQIGEPHISEEQGEAFLEKWRQECLEFKRAIIDEYAEKN